jgi:hypothetical protein
MNCSFDILDYSNEVVNYFVFRYDAGEFAHDLRWQASRCISAIAGVSQAEQWLLTYCKKSSIAGYQLDKESSADLKRAVFQLCKIAREHDNYDIKNILWEDFKKSGKVPPPPPKNKQKQKIERKPTQDEISLRENLQKKYDVLLSRFNNARTVVDSDFKTNPYLSKKSKHILKLSDNIRICGYDLLIKSETTTAIQIVNPYRKIDKLVRTCKKDESRGKHGSYAQVSVAPVVDGEDLYIVEGIATAFPFVQAGFHTYWAIDAGNLKHATAELRAKYPNSKLIIGADNDKKSQAGIKGARACGNVDILLSPADDTDWNDIWLESGDYGFCKELQLAEDNRIIEPLESSFNTRYLSDFINIERLISRKTIIKSNQETGKTTLALKLISETINTGRVVYIAYSRALVRAIYEELLRRYPEKQISIYSDFSAKHVHLQVLNLADVVVVTPESIYKVSTATPIDTLIIDEISSVLSTFNSKKTQGTNLTTNTKKMHELIADSNTVISIDADVTDGVKLFIEQSKENQGAFEVAYCENKFKFTDRTLNIYAKDHLRKLLLDNSESGEKSAIACSTKRVAEELYYTIKHASPEKKILLFTSKTNEDEQALELLITRDATEYDHVIYTMAAGVGVDVNKHNFDKVYMFAEHVQGLTEEKIRQLMQRFRKVKDYHVSFCARDLSAVSHKYLQKEVSPGNEAEQIISITGDMITKDIKESDDTGLTVYYPKIDKQLLSRIALDKTKAHNSAMNWNDVCIGMFKYAGFKLEFHCNPLSKKEVTISNFRIKKGRQFLQEAKEHEFNTKEPGTYQWLKTNNDRDNKTYYKKLKTTVSIVTKDINEKTRLVWQYRLYNSPKKYHKAYAITKLMHRNKVDHNKFVREIKAKDKASYLTKEDFYNINRKMYKVIFDFVGYNPLTQEIEKEVYWSGRYSIDKINAVLLKAGVPLNENSYEVSVLNCLLRDAGLVLCKTRRRDGDERYTEYSINTATIPKNIVTYIINVATFKQAQAIDTYLCDEFIKNNPYINKTTVDPPEAKTA